MASDIDPLIGTPIAGHGLIDSEGDIDIDLDLCSDILVDENVIPTAESYSFNMVAEQDEESDNPEGRRVHKNKQFWCQMKVFMERMFQQENK
eukprot:9444441-Karenia_brevis.AAC.1